MSNVRSKICGITRIEDALAAAEAGPMPSASSSMPKSPRAVDVRQARAIIAELPPFVTTVGLFVNASRCELNEILEVVPLDLLQFHGDETPQDCEGYHRPWIKALRVRPGDDLEAACRLYAGARGILLDTYVPGVPGGTGEAFDWSLVPARLSKPIILAGGLSADNVGQAIAQVRPYAVDVSGGVEQAKGIKDAAKIEAFMRAVKQA